MQESTGNTKTAEQTKVEIVDAWHISVVKTMQANVQPVWQFNKVITQLCQRKMCLLHLLAWIRTIEVKWKAI